MGTNYYAFSRVECDCGEVHESEHLHLGKSSRGWYFLLHSIPEKNLTSLGAWVEYLQRGCVVIEEGYGKRISLEEMLKTIKNRRHLVPWQAEALIANYAEPGLNNLARPQVDGLHCLSHGEGTWSMIAGEFS